MYMYIHVYVYNTTQTDACAITGQTKAECQTIPAGNFQEVPEQSLETSPWRTSYE